MDSLCCDSEYHQTLQDCLQKGSTIYISPDRLWLTTSLACRAPPGFVSLRSQVLVLFYSWRRICVHDFRNVFDVVSPGRWLPAKVRLGPRWPNAGNRLPLLFLLLHLLHLPGGHLDLPAHHGRRPSCLQLGSPGALHRGVWASEPGCVETRLTLLIYHN